MNVIVLCFVEFLVLALQDFIDQCNLLQQFVDLNILLKKNRLQLRSIIILDGLIARRVLLCDNFLQHFDLSIFNEQFFFESGFLPIELLPFLFEFLLLCLIDLPVFFVKILLIGFVDGFPILQNLIVEFGGEDEDFALLGTFGRCWRLFEICW